MSFDDDFDEDEEPSFMELEVKDGVANIKKEPFITIELEKESDLINLQYALKLQELVKERLKGAWKSGHKKLSDETGYLEQELQSLVEQSQTTDKEEGKAS